MTALVRGDADGGFGAEALSWRGSGESFGAATANALIIRPSGQAAVSSEDAVSVILLERIQGARSNSRMHTRWPRMESWCNVVLSQASKVSVAAEEVPTSVRAMRLRVPARRENPRVAGAFRAG